MHVVPLLLLLLAANGDEEGLRRTILPHPDAGYWVGGQINIITQAHPPFLSPYQGENSFRPNAEAAVSLFASFFSALRLASWTDALIHVEMAAGGGLSTALGLAGFTNLDVVRNPSLGAEPYLGRAMLRQIIPLGTERVDVEGSPFGTARSLPTHRLEIRAGKMSTVDIFDSNTYGSDSHLQFLNWTVNNNGAYDYAADTRGYTYGVVLEWIHPVAAIRFAEMLMPKVANGLDLDWDFTKSRAENLEVELRYRIAGREGAVRLLGYLNHANMGSYREAIDAFHQGVDLLPDIEAHRQKGRLKVGAGVNFEQTLIRDVAIFGRGGWNEGEHESFAYTEVNDTFLIGLWAGGDRWHRPGDRTGAAFVTNGLSQAHREYLALGGKGFILGDGALNYDRETIAEAFYTAQVWHGLYAAADVQGIWNPGYNHDRGPVFVGSFRLHADF